MRKDKLICGFTAVLMAAVLCGCTAGKEASGAADNVSAVPTAAASAEAAEVKIEEEDNTAAKEQTAPDAVAADDQSAKDETEEEEMKDPVLLYMGHASLRIVTGEDKVIYIDPFAGTGYDMTADLILQTHDHFDHKDMSKISSKSSDCVVITQKEALKGGTHQSFDQGYVKVEAVEAGYNKNHDKKNCVGYILTFSNGATLYVSGDTSKTDQMPELASRNLDYAFFCCDGVFNMDAEEASECASLVGAKANIPYHTGSASETIFDETNAARFNAPGAYVLKPGEELVLKKGQ